MGSGSCTVSIFPCPHSATLAEGAISSLFARISRAGLSAEHLVQANGIVMVSESFYQPFSCGVL